MPSWTIVGRPGVAAIVAAYRPTRSLSHLVVELARQVEAVILVDDSGDEGESLSHLGLGSEKLHNLTVITNPTNFGLAASLNAGVRSAEALQLTAVFTFDQDSTVPAGYVDAMLAHLERQQGAGERPLAGGPQFVGDSEVRESHSWAGGSCSLYRVQSGMVFSVDLFKEIGMFREEFVIDGLEQDLLLRMHRRGLHSTTCPGLRIGHQIGSPRNMAIFGHRIELSGHPPYRHYYIWRNHLTWIAEGWRDEPAFSKGGLRWLLKWGLLSLLFDERRGASLVASVRGIAHFRQRRYGRWRY